MLAVGGESENIYHECVYFYYTMAADKTVSHICFPKNHLFILYSELNTVLLVISFANANFATEFPCQPWLSTKQDHACFPSADWLPVHIPVSSLPKSCAYLEISESLGNNHHTSIID